ncbi:hypothetical protein DL93DRAFT_2092336, partial [Clavulina sp. PMI_390]
MKSDVIRKRARQEARKSSSAGTPSASPANSTGASPAAGPPPTIDTHTSNPPHPFEFSASAFEFSPVTTDTTDRLTHQHESQETNGFNSALSPGTTSYLENLQLQYPSVHQSMHPQSQDFHSFDLTSSFEQVFQDDGTKRRRVSPESDFEHGVASSSTSSVASSMLSGQTSSDQTDATSFSSTSPMFDPFTSYFPYTFNFNPTPSGWAPSSSMAAFPLHEEEGVDLLTGGPTLSTPHGPMDD